MSCKRLVPYDRVIKLSLLGFLVLGLSLLAGCGGDNSSTVQPHHTPTPTPTISPTPTPTPTGVPTPTPTPTLTPTPTPTPTPVHIITGFLYDGAPSTGNPVSGASITAYQAGATGYGKGAIQLAQVSSQSDGSFTIPILTCQGSGYAQDVYLVATGGSLSGQQGGNPAIALNVQEGGNSAIALSAALGPCYSLPDSVVVNEVTTVATTWALSQFLDSTGQDVGTSATNQTGLSNAADIVTLKNLVDVTTGLAPASFPQGLTSPTAALYSLANILAGCVISSGAGSAACQSLFTAATPPGSNAPATTLEAALDIARNPVNNVNSLFNLVPAKAPYTPGLSAAPGSWLLTLNYAPSNAQFSAPYALAIDAPGNVWVVNGAGDSVTELIAASGYTNVLNLSPPGANLDFPTALAFDSSGNLWVVNLSNNSVSELTAASGYETGFNFAPAAAAFNSPFALAFDAAGNLWITNLNSDSVSALLAGCSSSSCVGEDFSNSNTGNPGAAFSLPAALALDPAGNLWVANYGNNSVSRLAAGCSSASCAGANFSNSNTGNPGAAFSNPISLGLDTAGNIWVANAGNDSVSELPAGCSSASCNGQSFNNSNTGSPGASFIFPSALALDSANNVWITNDIGNSLSELVASSSYKTGLNFTPWATYQGQFAVVGDAAGNLWMVNNHDSSVTEAIGLSAPVLTPLQACLKQGHNVCLP
ncbi:MAG: NHL repeat-containing protein [Candidatus Binataceae bacterium]